MNTIIKSISKNYPRLTDEQTKDLCNRIKNGDQKARDILALSNIGLIYKACAQFHVPEQDLDDMFEECFEEYLEKIDRYNPEKGSFSTFIFSWLRNKLNRNNSKGIPSRVLQNSSKVRKIEEYFLETEDRLPTEDEILSYSGFSKKMYKNLKNDLNFFNSDSLDRPLTNDEGDATTLGAFVADCTHQNPESSYIEADLMKKLSVYFSQLTPNQQKALDCVFNLSGKYKEELSLRKAGEVLGLTHQAVANNRDSALRKLKQMFEHGCENIAA